MGPVTVERMDNHSHHREHHHAHRDEPGLADTLDLDAEVLGAYLDEVIGWARRHLATAPRTVADMGAGTGVGTLALARTFETAGLVAIDNSDVMLDRLRTSASREKGLGEGRGASGEGPGGGREASGPGGRLRLVRADLDDGWPEVGEVDLVWASSSLHHVADPARLLRGIHAALSPDGLLVVVEMDALPRFLPRDLGAGRPGLEERCHEAAASAGWNAYPDWRPHLEKAGFEVAGQRDFPAEVSPAPPAARRYARAVLARFRSSLGDRLAADDLAALDHLLAGDALNRLDLTVRSVRTAWAARRRGPSGS